MINACAADISLIADEEDTRTTPPLELVDTAEPIAVSQDEYAGPGLSGGC